MHSSMNILVQQIILASSVTSGACAADSTNVAESSSIPMPMGMPCAFQSLAVPRANIEKWIGRVVYFIVTDRFARSDPSDDKAPACAGKDWCGGTFHGIQRHLDYIQNMGFDAIWITPVVKQVDWRDKYNGTAYHGYWALDFNKIDPHLGTEKDLLDLKTECEYRGMLLMLDVVANHVGPISQINHMQQLGPHLNHADGFQFHQLFRRFGQSLSDYIKRPPQARDFIDKCGQDYERLLCGDPLLLVWGWYGDLADLNQESPDICNYLTDWISNFARKYRVDGLRLDTAIFMPKWFLRCFQNAAATFMIGEVWVRSVENHHYYSDALTGLLNFPVSFRLAESFGKGGSMKNLQQVLETQSAGGYPDLHLLGNFLDNHDWDRFLYKMGGDVSRLKNGLAWIMFYHGIPIIYQGTEQLEVSGMADEPETRRSMWPNFGISEMYRFLAELGALRKQYGFAAGGKDATRFAEVVIASAAHLVFVRGELLILLTNSGQGQQTTFCLKFNLLPFPWNNVCQKIEAHIVLGNASNLQCVEDEICLESTNGCPSAFALREDPVVIVS